MSIRRRAITAAVGIVAAMPAALCARGAEPIALGGPAMGTVWRVTLAVPIADRSSGAIHREIEMVLARLDRALSTWRDDSTVSRFNAAAADEWIAIDRDLVAVIAACRSVHAASGGAFDPTVLPLVEAWQSGTPAPTALAAARMAVGFDLVESREAAGTAVLRKRRAGVRLDLGGIGPGWAVDALGDRLVELGSGNHLVCLGGECRAWGERAPGRPWQVHLDPAGPGAPARSVDLPAGMALATSTSRPGRSPIDPRTGLVVAGAATGVTIRGSSCALADAWAVALLVQSADPGWPGRQTGQLPPGSTLERIGGPPAPR